MKSFAFQIINFQISKMNSNQITFSVSIYLVNEVSSHEFELSLKFLLMHLMIMTLSKRTESRQVEKWISMFGTF